MSTDILFSTTPTDWTALEGLYVAIQKQEGYISGANLNTVGLFDTCVRGPTTPQVLGSMGDFLDLYGGRDYGAGGTIIGKVWQALLNRKFSFPMVVCRVAAAAAVKASYQCLATATPIIKVEATSVGVWANGATGTGITVQVVAASDGDANHFNLIVNYLGTVTTYRNLDVHSSGVDNTTTVIGSAATNLITVTKLASGRPDNLGSAANLASGADGTVALSDYEAAFDAVAGHALVRIVPVACGQCVNTAGHEDLNQYVETKAANYPLSMFLAWAGEELTRANDIIAKDAAFATGADNIAWCWNPSDTTDSSGNTVQSGPHLDMAAILNNTDVAVHPGDAANIPILSGVKALYAEGVSRGDLVLLRAAGICPLEKVADGFQFHCAVSTTSSGVIGDATSIELADVRRRAWLVESIINSIRYDVKKAGTDTVRRSIINKIVSFLRSDQKAEHVVAPDDDTLGPAWTVGFVETPVEKARNIAKLMVRVRLLPYNLTIVMLTDIGTGVTTVKTA